MSDDTRLGRELAELEATDPAVAKAAANYEKVKREIIDGNRAFVIFKTPVGKKGKKGNRWKVDGAAQVRILSIADGQCEVEVVHSQAIPIGRKRTFPRNEIYFTSKERAYFKKLIFWLWAGVEDPGPRPPVEDT